MTLERSAALQWLVIIGVLAWLMYLLSPILTPFVAAGIVAYICNPLVTRLCELKIPRAGATLLVLLLLLGLLALLVLIMLPLLAKEIDHVMTRLPALLDMVRLRLLPYLEQQWGISVQWDSATLENLVMSHWQGAGSALMRMLPWLGDRSSMVITLLVDIVLVPIALFYMLCEWPVWVKQLDQLVPRHWHAKVVQIATEVDTVLAEFLRGQIALMLVMSVFYSVGMWLVGLEFALPIGIIAGMLVFVPYLGMIAGLTLATLAAFTQFDHFTDVLLVWAVFGTGQMLEAWVFTPWLVGKRIGLHPLTVIFALLAFGQLFGFFGVLLALPLSAILLVAMRHVRNWYLGSRLYQSDTAAPRIIEHGD
jgi:predicted PurR-regulated permease PerM